jgi:hypothetical protein
MASAGLALLLPGAAGRAMVPTGWRLLIVPRSSFLWYGGGEPAAGAPRARLLVHALWLGCWSRWRAWQPGSSGHRRRSASREGSSCGAWGQVGRLTWLPGRVPARGQGGRLWWCTSRGWREAQYWSVYALTLGQITELCYVDIDLLLHSSVILLGFIFFAENILYGLIHMLDGNVNLVKLFLRGKFFSWGQIHKVLQ